MAETSFDAEELEAGITKLNEAFGSYATFDAIAKHTGLTEEEVARWTYYKFYTKVSYLSHVNAYQKRLRDIINRK